jgi:N-acetylglutamate synthase-like GNAT family acetyltransferase
VGLLALTNILLGSSALLKHDMETKTHLTPWLASAYVAEPYRRQGIGSKLVLHAMKKAKEDNFEKLYLFTPDQENFYKKLGWTSIEKDIYHNHKIIIMQTMLQRITRQTR